MQSKSFELSLKGTQFTSLSFTKNSKLTSLSIDGVFTDIDISGNSSLTSFDVSKFLELESLNVSGCGLQSLDVTKNLNLKSLDCHDNALSTLNVRSNTALKTLNVKSNSEISHVDLRNNPVLEDLNASGLSISELDLTGITQLKTLDVTDNAKLLRAICPSSTWLRTLNQCYNDLSLLYVNNYAEIIGGAMIEIDGVMWSGYNFGSTAYNMRGDGYTFSAAQNACPEGWRTPTKSELESLSANYSSETKFNGMSGRWFSGSKTYSSSVPAVFLPCLKGHSSGDYWSSTVTGSNNAYYLYFYSSSVRMYYGDRSDSYAVRCLKN